MGATIGTVGVDVELNQAQIAAEANQAGRAIEAGLGNSANKVRSEFSSASKALVAGFAAYQGVQFLGNAIDAASDLAEQQSKVGVVFGNSSDAVIAFGDDAANAIGQSRRSALEAAGTFGNLFSAVGINQAAAAKMSTALTTLASDLASFNNTSVDDALTALRSGLVGETEPLKRFGVNLNEATLKAKALELGLSDGTGVLDANAKAQAAYALILEQTTTAQGDFQRTAGGLANQQRILSAEWENAQASLGEALVPAAKVAVSVLGDLAKVLQVIPAPIVAGGLAVGGLTLAYGLLAPAIRRGWSEMTAFTAAQEASTAATVANTSAVASNAAASSGVAGGLGRIAGGAGLVSAALPAAVAGFAAFEVTTQFLEDSARFKNLDALARDLDQIGSGSRDPAVLFDSFGGDVDTFIDHMNDAFAITNGVDAAIGGLQDTINLGPGPDAGWVPSPREAKKAQNEFKALDDQLVALYNENPDAAIQAFAAYSEAVTKAGGDTSLLVELLPKFNDLRLDEVTATGAAGDAHAKTAEDVQKEFDAMVDLYDAERDLSDAKANTIEAVNAYHEAQAAAQGDSEEYRRALQDIADAEQGAADAARDVRQAQLDLNDARRQAAEDLQQLNFAAEGAALSEERAQIRLEVAVEEERKTLGDPKATDRDKREATLSRKEAELQLREAQDRRADSARELNEADARGIEGSDRVVAAKQRVADTLDRQREAQNRVTEANQRAATIIEEAKKREAEAAKDVEDAVLDQAEAERAVAELTGDAKDAADAYIESLHQTSEFLDPKGEFRTNLHGYLEDLRDINEQLSAFASLGDLLAGAVTLPDLGGGKPHNATNGNAPDITGPVTPSGGSGGALGGGAFAGIGGKTTNIYARTSANPKEIGGFLAFPRGGN